MAEQIALVFGVGILMFYLLEFSTKWKSDDEFQDSYLSWVRLFYVMLSMVMGLVLVWVIYNAAVDVGANTSTLGGLRSLSLGWGVIILVTAFLIPIYYLFLLPKMLKKMQKEIEDA